MPVTVTGRVTDETGAVLPKLTAEACGDWLTTEQLAQDEAVTKDRERIGTVQTHDLGEGKMTTVRAPNNLIRDVMFAVVLKHQSGMVPILTSGPRGCRWRRSR